MSSTTPAKVPAPVEGAPPTADRVRKGLPFGSLQKSGYIHLIFGFVFAFIDTDGFLAELNPFTFDSVFGGEQVRRVYDWGFTFYFIWLSAKFLRLRWKSWWGPAALCIGVYAFYAMERLVSDGHLFRIYTSADIRNTVLLGLVAGFLANPASWEGWFKPYCLGAGSALLTRSVCHFFGAQQDTAAMIGVDTVGFYGSFNIHCVLMFGLGLIAAVWFGENRRWYWMASSVAVALVFLTVVTSGFRRAAILEAVLVPLLGFVLAFWLRRQSIRGVAVAVTVSVLAALCVGAVAVGLYGAAPAHERLLSLIKPTEQSTSMDSNLSYMDDWSALGDVLEKHPFGVGYGNPYGVSRYLEATFQGTDVGEYEAPLHVGQCDLIARAGPFGALALIGLLWTVIKPLVWLRGRISRSGAMLAGGCAAFFLVTLLFPAAPSTGILKLTVTYGIALGLVLQIAARRQAIRSPALPFAGRRRVPAPPEEDLPVTEGRTVPLSRIELPA